jgi:hypothetical protein
MDSWKFDPTIPNDPQSEEGAAQQLELDERVYLELCLISGFHGLWRLSTEEDLNVIASDCFDEETRQLFRHAHLYRNQDEETWLLSRARQAFETSLQHLSENGRITWVIRGGWPWIQVHGREEALIAEFGNGDGSRAAQIERQRELATMPYTDYLLTPEWQHRRLDQLDRAGYRCQMCNREPRKGNPLHVHHRTYANRGNERPGDLIVLCKNCHFAFHEQFGVE